MLFAINYWPVEFIVARKNAIRVCVTHVRRKLRSIVIAVNMKEKYYVPEIIVTSVPTLVVNHVVGIFYAVIINVKIAVILVIVDFANFLQKWSYRVHVAKNL